MSPPQRHIHRGCPESPAVPGTPTPASRTPPPRPPDPYQAAGQPNAGQAGTDDPPDADAALAQALSSRQLQEEQRDAQEEEEQQVEQEEGTWRGQEGEGVMGLPAPPPPPQQLPAPPSTHRPHSGGRGRGSARRCPGPRRSPAGPVCTGLYWSRWGGGAPPPLGGAQHPPPTPAEPSAWRGGGLQHADTSQSRWRQVHAHL